jgi:hypothetical protein
MFAFLVPVLVIASVVTITIVRRRGDQARAEALLQRLHLIATAEPDAAWDDIVPIPRSDESEHQVRRMIFPGDQRVRSELRFDPTHAWLRADRTQPGIVAAFRLKVHVKARTMASSRSTTRLANEAVTFRLRRGTGVQMYLTPDYQPMSKEQAMQLGAWSGMAQDIAEDRIDDPLLFNWYSQGFGSVDRGELAHNARLRAVLWALRVKAPTPKHADRADVAALEGMIPPVERLTSYDFLAIDDDVVTIVRQGGLGRQAISEKFARLAEHLAAY